MPIRSVAPEFKTVDEVQLIQADCHQLDNNIPLFTINAGDQDVLKIDFVFQSGSRFQPIPLVAGTVNNMLNEGTINRSANEIAEIVDFYGAFLQTESGKDFSTVTLYTLNKHLESVLPIIKEILTEAAFSENELEIYINNARQKFQIESQKVSFLARKHFMNMLFGNDNFYGYNLKENDYEQILLSRDLLKDFYRINYAADHCFIIISGKINDQTVKILNNNFGKNWSRSGAIIKEEFFSHPSTEQKKIIEKKDAIQSAIRIGRVLFNKTHQDWMGLQVLNTVLGGYFGSRLMANIREDKGYTYGIGSGLVSMQKAGYFFISTEVGVDVCSNAINEIYKEIDRLKSDLIPNEELDLVKNYMMGVFLRNSDGPFALSDRFRGVYDYGLGYEYYDRYLNTVKKITSEDLQRLAQKYFQKEDLLELVVGKK
jgi:zinc protease